MLWTFSTFTIFLASVYFNCALSVLSSSVQTVYGSRWPQRKAETEADPDHLHQRPAEGAGASLRGDSLSRHLHERGAGAKNRPHGSTSAGSFSARSHKFCVYFRQTIILQKPEMNC